MGANHSAPGDSKGAHAHAHVHVTAGRVLTAAGITVLAAGLELFGSWAAGSLFLTSDAVHLLAHLAIFVVLLQPKHDAHDRREDIATCIILGLVLVIALGIGAESVHGLLGDRPSPRPAILLLSLSGLGANIASAFLFRDPARERFSFRAALAHELSDASLTLVALLGAGAIALFHLDWIDPALSLAVAVFLLVWALRLVVKRVRLGRAAWQT